MRHSPAPIGRSNCLSAGINLYAYVGNDPASFRDPFGLGPDEFNCESSPECLKKQQQAMAWFILSIGQEGPANVVPGAPETLISPQVYCHYGCHGVSFGAQRYATYEEMMPLYYGVAGIGLSVVTFGVAAVAETYVGGGALIGISVELGTLASGEAVPVGGTTSLFRAVGPAELADIQATGTLRSIPGLEGKYFTTSAEAASSYGRQAVRRFGDPPYTLIRTEVPNSAFRGLTSVPVDGGISTWVIPNSRLQGLTPQVLGVIP